MRKAIMGVGALLIVVGLVQLILSIIMVGGIRAQVEDQVKGIGVVIDPVIKDATGTLTEVADALDGAVVFLKDMDTTLANAEKTVGDTVDNSLKYLGDFDTSLDNVGKTVSDTADAVTSVRNTTKEFLEQWVVEITADDLAYWGDQMEYAGYDAYWFRGWADYLKAEGMVLSVTAEVEITADDLAYLADQMEYAGYDVTLIQGWADYLESAGLVLSLTGEDVAAVFAPVTENLDLASDSLADVSGLLGTIQTSLKDVKGLAADSISGVSGYLTTAQTDLGDIGGSLRTMTTNIKGIDVSGAVSGMVGGVVDGVIGPLQMYMIFSSILFMLAGVGLLLTGLVFIRRTEV